MKKSSLGPGFRFHPTDVELVMYFLKKKLLGKKLLPEVIGEVNLYDFSPWDLPDKSLLRNGDLEWFFFSSKSKKYSNGSRINRATENGYWKATGKDREVKYNDKTVAMIKTLVFHLGHPPKGTRTNWVMHEFRMVDKDLAMAGVVQDSFALCRLFEKSGVGPKNGANYGAPFEEEDWDDDDDTEIVNPMGIASTSTNLTSTEPVPCTVISFESERHLEKSTETFPTVFGLFGATNTQIPCASSSTVTNMTPTDPGPSTIPSSDNERHHVPANDYALVLHNNNTQEVEDHKGKKIMTDVLNEDDIIDLDSAADMFTQEDVIDLDSVDMFTLDDLSPDAFNMVSVDTSAGFMSDPFSVDDLDVDLREFF